MEAVGTRITESNARPAFDRSTMETPMPITRRLLAVAAAVLTLGAGSAAVHAQTVLRYSNWLPVGHPLRAQVIEPWVEHPREGLRVRGAGPSEQQGDPCEHGIQEQERTQRRHAPSGTMGARWLPPRKTCTGVDPFRQRLPKPRHHEGYFH